MGFKKRPCKADEVLRKALEAADDPAFVVVRTVGPGYIVEQPGLCNDNAIRVARAIERDKRLG